MSGIYTYSIFDHKPEYPFTSLGEARFLAKLNDDVFDWMTVDANRNMQSITTQRLEHRHGHEHEGSAANEHPAFTPGRSSNKI